MSFKAKRYFTGLLDTGHRHREMKEMMLCNYCGARFKKAEREYKRISQEHPEDFKRKEPDTGFGIETQNLGQMLEDRIKQDKLYKEHLRLMAFGTPEEKQREIKRVNAGFYERHVGESSKKLII